MNKQTTTPLVGVYGGGPIYKNPAVGPGNVISELRASGFTEVVVWNIAVDDSGDLNFNGEFPLVSGGTYIGGNTYPQFPANMAALKTAPTTVTRLTFSIGSSNWGVFQAIEALVTSQGTGPSSILYQNFVALKAAIPGIDAIDFDDENYYNTSSMVAFAVMLGGLGYEVTLCPYTKASFWQDVATKANAEQPGTVTGVHLQCYSGGGGNSPCSGWDFGSVPVWPGMSSSADSPQQVQQQLSQWHESCRISGGWMWILDDFYKQPSTTTAYATAIHDAL